MLQTDNDMHWFVMRDLRRSNARVTAYSLLMEQGYEAFTPMTLSRNRKTGAKELVPIMRWLLFVHATKGEIDRLIVPSKPQIPHLQYIFERGKSSRLGGMTVDDRSMGYFRAAIARQEIPVVYRYGDITPDMRGRRVLVTRGDLMGYRGCLQKYTGGKGMRLFVELDGYCLAPVQVSPEDITFLDERPATMSPEEEQAHYTRLSRLVDIVNYLRFSMPQSLDSLTDEQLDEVHRTYRLASLTLDSCRTREYLCIDEVCHDRLAVIERELSRRTAATSQSPAPEAKPTKPTKRPHKPVIMPWYDRMTQLCQKVNS